MADEACNEEPPLPSGGQPAGFMMSNGRSDRRCLRADRYINALRNWDEQPTELKDVTDGVILAARVLMASRLVAYTIDFDYVQNRIEDHWIRLVTGPTREIRWHALENIAWEEFMCGIGCDAYPDFKLVWTSLNPLFVKKSPLALFNSWDKRKIFTPTRRQEELFYLRADPKPRWHELYTCQFRRNAAP